MPNKVAIFDLDDTLIECQVNYNRKLVEFVNKMFEVFKGNAPHPKEILDFQSSANIKFISEHGYTGENFQISFTDTYEHFYQKIYGKSDYCKKTWNEIYSIGESVFDCQPHFMENALSVVEDISKKYPVYLFTAGNYNRQMFKIRESGLDKIVPNDNIFIREFKTVDTISEVIEDIRIKYSGISEKNIFMIGDSLKNDIYPSIKTGITPIHIKRNSWGYNNIEIDEPFISIKKIEDILGIIK